MQKKAKGSLFNWVFGPILGFALVAAIGTLISNLFGQVPLWLLAVSGTLMGATGYFANKYKYWLAFQVGVPGFAMALLAIGSLGILGADLTADYDSSTPFTMLANALPYLICVGLPLVILLKTLAGGMQSGNAQ